MGFRFSRRVHLCPGLSVNLSRSGPSLTFGVRGAHLTVGSTGVRRTVGIPGTGVFYTTRQGYHTGYHAAKSDAPLTPTDANAASQRVERRLVLILLVVVVLVIVAML